MAVIIDGTAGIANNATDLSYTGTLTGGTGVVNLGSGQVYKDASGNVGIGTSSPSQILTIGNTSTTRGQLYLQSPAGSSPTATLDYTAQSGGHKYTLYSGAPNAGDFAIYDATAAAYRAIIDSSGNLLVGTTSVLGASAVGSTHIVGGANDTESGPLFLRNRFSTAGNYWKVGPSSNAGFIIFNASGTGQYQSYGGTSWIAVSDERLKTNLLPIENAAQKVSTLRAVTGRYKTDEESVSRSFLIAQDVQAVFPEAVDAANPDQLGVSYTEVIPLLVAAIKEQQTLIVSLQDTLTALTARITALEAPIV